MTRYFSFLLFCVLAFTGGESRRPKRLKGENCRLGRAVVGEFYENPCQDDPFLKLRAAPSELLSVPWTVEKMRTYFSRYCSEAMPELRRCFADLITDCEPSQQQHLNELATSTSWVCQANSTVVHPWLVYLLSRLTNAEVAEGSRRCTNSRLDADASCIEQARASIGLDIPANASYLHSASVEELVPYLQTFQVNFTDCKVQSIRQQPNRCENWRVQALLEMITLTGPPILGLRVSYTEAQIAAMFEFPIENRRSIFPFK